MASPVIEQMVRQSKSQSRSRKKPISIGGVPHRAVHVFLRFLYSCIVVEEALRGEAGERASESGECGGSAPAWAALRRSEAFSEGWKVMKQSNLCMEKEIHDSVVQADLLNLLLVSWDGMADGNCSQQISECGTRDPDFRFQKSSWRLIHCKRMWQLLKLHSRLCEQNHGGCKVPLCWHFKEKVRNQSRKEEVKWKLLNEIKSQVLTSLLGKRLLRWTGPTPKTYRSFPSSSRSKERSPREVSPRLPRLEIRKKLGSGQLSFFLALAFLFLLPLLPSSYSSLPLLLLLTNFVFLLIFLPVPLFPSLLLFLVWKDLARLFVPSRVLMTNG
ncbi:BTB/POZ and TAZ domain-containing protein 3 [Dendrobium catenatum]|uniref:BTB/POZ and TAZ domain-containing protein 3 n=1 Tax=Dendrobium catenatum TaxID=906689 RepID=A0A2I0V7U3_9ASPA|nr:BTB/POZ and TAZ domain-containing protein 3 [Dendrobium catenatum]